jgi:lysophospholipase L1-like esterase
VAIKYAFDLYPRADPVNGTRTGRFSKPQQAEYKGEANGTGSGRVILRGSSTDADSIDPAGMQYIRVVRINDAVGDGATLSGFSEKVVGGFFLENGQFEALTERSTKKLNFGGAGALSYLGRAVAADEAYLTSIATSTAWKVTASGSVPAGWHDVGFDDSTYTNAVRVTDSRWFDGCSARWIWEDAGEQGSGEERAFRKEFELPTVPAAPTLLVTADNGCEVYINGTLVATVGGDERGANDEPPLEHESIFTFGINPALLTVGTNCISIIGWNSTIATPGPAGVYAALTDPDLPGPEEGIWYFPDQTLGAILWRMISEAQSPNRPQAPIADVTLTFSQTLDSDGNAWTGTNSITAQVGENLLSIIQRLMAAGLYISMDPDTFELSAWPATAHGRDRTGVAWGTNVIRFQAPTDGTIATGNIKSDAKRGIGALIKRSDLLVGNGDIFQWVNDPAADLVWEGGYQVTDPNCASLAAIGAAQLLARADAGDTVRLRMVLGTDPASGSYLPFEDILLDDTGTLHNGTGQWDWDETEQKVAAISLKLRPGSDWDAWIDLGSAFSSLESRAFQVQPVGAHTHPPNPRLCGDRAVDRLFGLTIGSLKSSSTGDTGAPATNANDADDDTPWGEGSGDPAIGVAEAYWAGDMGTARSPNEYRILQQGGLAPTIQNVATEVRIYGSNDSAAWTWLPTGKLVADPAANDWTLVTTFTGPLAYNDSGRTFFAAVSYRYWLFRAVSGGTADWDVEQFELWEGTGLSGTDSTAARCDHGHTHDELLLRDAAESHPASAVSVVPFETIAATDVQAALEEILDEAGSVPLTAPELLTFRAACAKRATTPVDIVAIGDSITEGGIAGSLPARWTSRLLDQLRGHTQPASITGGVGYRAALHGGTTATAWTEGGSVVLNTTYGLGRRSAELQSGDSLTAEFEATAFDILWAQVSGGGTFSYAIDGGSATNVSTAGTTEGGHVTSITGLSVGTHEIVIAGVSGTAIVEGVMVYDGDEAAGIRMWEAGHGGYKASDYTASSVWLDSLETVQPDLVIITLGVNDWRNDISSASFSADIAEIISDIRAVCTIDPSFVLMASFEPTDPSPPAESWDDYIAAMVALADAADDIIFVNIDERMGSVAPATTLGLINADLVHPTAAGHQFFADALAETLAFPGNDVPTGIGDHLADAADAHDASAVSVADAGGYFTGTEVEAALQELGADVAAAGRRLLTVDAGTPTYDDSGADVVISLASNWGYDADGPYYNSAGVTAGEEAILAFDPDVGDFAVVPYNP